MLRPIQVLIIFAMSLCVLAVADEAKRFGGAASKITSLSKPALLKVNRTSPVHPPKALW